MCFRLLFKKPNEFLNECCMNKNGWHSDNSLLFAQELLGKEILKRKSLSYYVQSHHDDICTERTHLIDNKRA